MEPDEKDRKRLGSIVRRRLDDLGHSKNHTATASGVAWQTWQKILDGKPMSRVDAISRMETYLHYMPGAFRRMLEDRTFTPDPPRNPLAGLGLQELADLLKESAARIEELASRPPDEDNG